MKNNFKHSATIEQYLANEMSPYERVAFRKEIKSNPELSQELKLSQNIDSALMRDDVIDLRRKLILAINAGRVVKEVPVIRMNSRKWWYAAASMLALCAVAATL